MAVDGLYDWAEAAELLRVRESWLRYKARRDEIPYTPIGRNYRFSPEDLLEIQRIGKRAAGQRPQTPPTALPTPRPKRRSPRKSS